LKPITLFDIEADGLLDSISKVHLIVVKDFQTKERSVYRRNEFENTIPQGVAHLKRMADEGHLLVAHNGIGYDYPALEKVEGLKLPPQACGDSMIWATLAWPEINRLDMDERAKKKPRYLLSGNLVGSYSLEAMGARLGLPKGDYEGDTRIADEAERKRRKWEQWNPDMETYGVQDVEVLDLLVQRILTKDVADTARELEFQVSRILARQERFGFHFFADRAVKLYAHLSQRRLELEEEVRKVFKPRFLKDGKTFTPKRDSAKHGYVAGAPMTKVKLTEFNPGSRDHVATWLTRQFGWQPAEFTNDGHPKVDDEVISQLPYPEAKPLKEYFMVCKRIGQIAEGNEAWLKKVGADGRMHGRVHPNKAVTGRMAHSGPNMGQIPAGYSPYGKECRECFGAPEGKVLVGIDAEALELRDLAGYMAIYDGGEYINTVLSGDKSKGTDMHSVNARALGLGPKELYFEGETGRDIAKTWFYAFIYGAGDEKLGFILTRRRGKPAAEAGGRARAAFLRNLPAMGKLVDAVKKAAKERGYLWGLDGRRLRVRSQHAALNTLLQSAGAIQMKRALCIFDDSMQAAGLRPGIDYEFVANVHDEWQLEVSPEHAQEVLRLGIDSIRLAGESFGFRCPLAGAGDIGQTWADTH